MDKIEKELMDAKDTIKFLKKQYRQIDSQFEKLKQSTTKELKRQKGIIDAHVNKQFAEWRVKEADGTWGDYTGMFYCDGESEKETVLKKARQHYDKYFVDSQWHKNKHLALFLTTQRGGKRIIEKRHTSKKYGEGVEE